MITVQQKKHKTVQRFYKCFSFLLLENVSTDLGCRDQWWRQVVIQSGTMTSKCIAKRWTTKRLHIGQQGDCAPLAFEATSWSSGKQNSSFSMSAMRLPQRKEEDCWPETAKDRWTSRQLLYLCSKRHQGQRQIECKLNNIIIDKLRANKKKKASKKTLCSVFKGRKVSTFLSSSWHVIGR